MNWLQIVTIAAFLAVSSVKSLSLDPVASTELEQYIKKGDCVISMRHIRPRRKLHISIEALFMIDFPTLKHKLSFFLDRMHQRVTLDVTANGATESKHFELPNTNETSTIRSLALHFHKNRIAMLVDCKESSTHELEISLAELYAQMETDPVIKLFRERKYPLYFDGQLEPALQRTNCQKGVHKRNKVHMMRTQVAEREKNKKRDVRNWFNNDSSDKRHEEERIPVEIEQRGDIPVLHGDCEDALAKSLSDLMELVKLLREDIANQRQEIAYLRRLLENCAGCKEPSSSSLRLEPTCRNANPCYPGVECRETATGVRCGRCPMGFAGDGKICKPGVTCADRPCFIGVQCRDTLNGAQCDSCPLGYDGDGRSCTLRSTNLLVPSHNVQHYQRQYTARKYSVISS
ncbi:uncharacterized protein LOC118735590 [Rhagoletis pomonella]|uniref:uncharacterized protein LOC118735590 n=1 Tax=Rhagoletis pomonella TaxID=28610 RepID=UPI0017805DFD|nr:uncharacterized protein LOC118735590 [Rhagoletis pomonella]XP_036321316.1 uncharacterized protein LOC118735590 [Rhagoletis pomonella]